jgi:hypothetical protein
MEVGIKAMQHMDAAKRSRDIKLCSMTIQSVKRR